jgi:SRSO17 transposase
MKTNKPSQTTREQRFDQYIEQLTEAAGYADRAKPLRDYCTGLLLPVERKSMEPIAAQVAPDNVKTKHQSLQQFRPGCSSGCSLSILNSVPNVAAP